MDNEKELIEQETAPKPKKQTKKKAPKQETPTEPETPTTETEQQSVDAPEQTTSESENPNWDWYNNVQNIHPKASKGGSNHTPSVRRNAQKRIRKAKTQRASRRINRRKWTTKIFLS